MLLPVKIQQQAETQVNAVQSFPYLNNDWTSSLKQKRLENR